MNMTACLMSVSRPQVKGAASTRSSTFVGASASSPASAPAAAPARSSRSRRVSPRDSTILGSGPYHAGTCQPAVLSSADAPTSARCRQPDPLPSVPRQDLAGEDGYGVRNNAGKTVNGAPEWLPRDVPEQLGPR